MRYTIYLFLFLFAFLQACGDQSHHGETVAVQADNGKPWQANSETTTGIAKMQTIIVDFEGGTMNEEDRKKLRKGLEDEFQNIFKQCTMTGEAHNQLHNYLLPMKGKFEKIDENDPKEAELAINELKHYLSTYKNYFE